MASTAITPTRMVLNQLKGRLKTARRGHKLLKDKRDELMRQFMEVIKQNKVLRTRVEEGLTAAFAGAVTSVSAPECGIECEVQKHHERQCPGVQLHHEEQRSFGNLSLWFCADLR